MAATSPSSFAARSRSTSSVVGTQRHAFPAWANRSASCTDRAWASYPSVPSGPKVASSWKNRSHTLVLSTSTRATSRAEAGEVARVEVDSTSVWDRFFQELATLGPLGTLGYEAHALSVHDAERFAQAGKAWRWVPTTELVERLRAAKDEGEVAAIRGAAQLAGEALRQTLVQVRPGMTGLAIAGVLEGALRRLGSEGHPFATIVASGPRSALPHARSSRRAVAAGEWLLLDFGA